MNIKMMRRRALDRIWAAENNYAYYGTLDDAHRVEVYRTKSDEKIGTAADEHYGLLDMLTYNHIRRKDVLTTTDRWRLRIERMRGYEADRAT